MTVTTPDLAQVAQNAADLASAAKTGVDASAFDVPSGDWPFDVHPVAGYVGAMVAGIDLRTPMTATVLERLQHALAHYGVLFFRGQHIEPEHHAAFGRQFGNLRTPAPYMEVLESCPDVCVISTENGKAYLTDQWHQDVSWPERPTRYSILHMRAIPSHGGDTLWSSLYLAYERLSPSMQDFLTTLTVRHGQPGNVEAMHFDHPLVIRHPVTGRRSIYANPVFTQRINELTPGESQALLAHLYAHATTPEFTCRWRWQVGDVAMWDNCHVMHYALGDYHPHYRMLHRIEIEGERLLPAVPVACPVP